MSKISKLTEFLKNSVSDNDPANALKHYHVANACMRAMRYKDPQERRARVLTATKLYPLGVWYRMSPKTQKHTVCLTYGSEEFYL